MALNKHNIIPLIESYYHTFTPLERTIADFFIHNTDEQDFSSKNVSRLLYVSEASLSRFAQKCGFHGYREFIYEYKQSLIPAPEENIPSFEISEFNTYQELLNKSNALLDKAQIARITNLLVSKPRVYVYGRGSSGLAAQEMKLRFMRIGLNIEAVTDSHIMKVNSVILDENCLVIGISVSGQTDDIISSLTAAHQRGAYTLLMTARQDKSYMEILFLRNFRFCWFWMYSMHTIFRLTGAKKKRCMNIPYRRFSLILLNKINKLHESSPHPLLIALRNPRRRLT